MAFLCYGRSMEQTKELDEDIYKEVVKILRQEREKAYWKALKSLKKKNKKEIRRNARTKYLR